MKLLIFARCLFPDSKKSTYENKELFFENHYKPQNEAVFYDVTNYYFEIDDPDELRKKGVCKEHRPNPIVQMGLFMDSLGLPMCYKLFEGNTNDCLTLKPMYRSYKKIIILEK